MHLAPSPALEPPDENDAQRRDNHLRGGNKELTKQAGAPTCRIPKVHPRGCFNASGVKRLAEPTEVGLGLETADGRLVGSCSQRELHLTIVHQFVFMYDNFFIR